MKIRTTPKIGGFPLSGSEKIAVGGCFRSSSLHECVLMGRCTCVRKAKENEKDMDKDNKKQKNKKREREREREKQKGEKARGKRRS